MLNIDLTSFNLTLGRVFSLSFPYMGFMFISFVNILNLILQSMVNKT